MSCDGTAQIGRAFATCRAQDRAALIAFLAAGDPVLDLTVRLALAAWEGGADVLELGVPYSDPLADGPVIQAAYTRALAAGASVGGVLECARRIARETGGRLPIVLMSSINPLLAFGGVESFCRAAAAVGVAGLIVPDLLPEDAGELIEAEHANALASIFLASPQISDNRLRAAAEASTGFLYLVSRRGVTGAGTDLKKDASRFCALAREVDRARRVSSVPICVGFGIASADDACAAGRIADGVIVGSHLVAAAAEARARAQDETAVAKLINREVHDLASALRRARGEEGAES